MNPGRNKTYEQLVHFNVTLPPGDLTRLDAIPGQSRNERIRHLLAVYDAARLVCAAHATENLAAILDFVTALNNIVTEAQP